jgi:uncharacterized protein YbjT (DUF2867 family)
VPDADGVHVVVGATGGTGSALVRELVGRGRRVRAVSRRGRADAPAGVEVVARDATDAERMREVCRGARPRRGAHGHRARARAPRSGRVTSYEAGIEATLRWYRDTPGRSLLVLAR